MVYICFCNSIQLVCKVKGCVQNSAKWLIPPCNPYDTNNSGIDRVQPISHGIMGDYTDFLGEIATDLGRTEKKNVVHENVKINLQKSPKNRSDILHANM